MILPFKKKPNRVYISLLNEIDRWAAQTRLCCVHLDLGLDTIESCATSTLKTTSPSLFLPACETCSTYTNLSAKVPLSEAELALSPANNATSPPPTSPWGPTPSATKIPFGSSNSIREVTEPPSTSTVITGHPTFIPSSPRHPEPALGRQKEVETDPTGVTERWNNASPTDGDEDHPQSFQVEELVRVSRSGSRRKLAGRGRDTEQGKSQSQARLNARTEAPLPSEVAAATGHWLGHGETAEAAGETVTAQGEACALETGNPFSAILIDPSVPLRSSFVFACPSPSSSRWSSGTQPRANSLTTSGVYSSGLPAIRRTFMLWFWPCLLSVCTHLATAYTIATQKAQSFQLVPSTSEVPMSSNSLPLYPSQLPSSTTSQSHLLHLQPGRRCKCSRTVARSSIGVHRISALNMAVSIIRRGISFAVICLSFPFTSFALFLCLICFYARPQVARLSSS